MIPRSSKNARCEKSAPAMNSLAVDAWVTNSAEMAGIRMAYIENKTTADNQRSCQRYGPVRRKKLDAGPSKKPSNTLAELWPSVSGTSSHLGGLRSLAI